jgi:hypothetical protein
VPPNKGTLFCNVIDGFVQKDCFYTLNAIDSQYAYKMAQTIGDHSLMSEAVVHSKMRFDEGLTMFKTIHKTVREKAQVLLKIFPLMRQPADNRQLLSKVTLDDFVELSKIKIAFGVTLRPLLGLFNGYYSLDLSKELHRVCLSRLLEQSTTYNDSRMEKSVLSHGKVGDLSQHGNWTCFRNEILNGKRVCVTAKFLTPMPSSGLLSFDFICGPIGENGRERDRESERLIVSDKKLLKVCRNICLLPTAKRTNYDDWEDLNDGDDRREREYNENVRQARAVLKSTQKRLRQWREKAKVKNREGSLFMPMYEFPQSKAFAVGMATDDFYDNLERRDELLKEGSKDKSRQINRGKTDEKDDESIGESVAESLPGEANISLPPNDSESATLNAQSVDGDSLALTVEEQLQTNEDDDQSILSNEVVDRFGNLKIKPLASDDDDDNSNEEGNKDEGDLDGQSFQERAKMDPTTLRKRKILETQRRLQGLLDSPDCNVHIRAQRFVEVIEETFQTVWLLMRHVATIVTLFQRLFGEDCCRCAFFGSYVCDIVVVLFPRIVDIHNFEMLFELLPANDCATIFCRIGILNFFNPLKPEVTYELDIGRREERVVAKIIVYLSVEEPGKCVTFLECALYLSLRWKFQESI